jgi:hypothetical protein
VPVSADRFERGRCRYEILRGIFQPGAKSAVQTALPFRGYPFFDNIACQRAIYRYPAYLPRTGINLSECKASSQTTLLYIDYPASPNHGSQRIRPPRTTVRPFPEPAFCSTQYERNSILHPASCHCCGSGNPEERWKCCGMTQCITIQVTAKSCRMQQSL